ncbi:hypothetical protein G3A49_16165 [Haloferax volcanii]|uniref:DUF8168 domain-containing protein n=1 Tax=Haloferax volcanii TaxID=2246 RepID=A0A558GDN5_HALVO|nr:MULTISPECIES: hypothetical protein [Haloferax]QIB80151.1 hypothetical protein G3A49_16165 [Haloferax alexandrinus]TVT95843.1 hypothetical protein FQA18_04360 [Haloferax volcanii]
MVAVYRHDIHKARMRGHEHAEESFRGMRVNEQVPLGADRDAALLSRPRGEPEQTLDAHQSWFRVSLLTGKVASTVEPVADVGGSLTELISVEDAEELHSAWLDSVVTSLFSESPYYPYTSLKYHTVLVAAVLDNYRSGFEFDELFLAVTPPGAEPEVVPHRTVLATSRFAVHVTGEPGDRPATRLGGAPARSFADVWARLPAIPFDVDGERRWRVLDAQLRRVRSWSTALQFIEEYVAALNPVTAGAGGDARGT